MNSRRFGNCEGLNWVCLTPGSSQIGASSSRLKELHDRLQSRTRDDSIREERPPNWRDHPVRSVIIVSYKKNTDDAYHRHNRMDWTTAQRARIECFHDAACAEYFTQPRIPEGAVHLVIGDSLIRVLKLIQSRVLCIFSIYDFSCSQFASFSRTFCSCWYST